MKEAPPLTAEQTRDLLRKLAGVDVVLVGGQAINLWANLYLSRIQALESEGPFTSKDIDFLGDKEAVRECASRLLGEAVFEAPFEREAPVNSGVVHFVDDHGIERTIDILCTVLGIDEHELRDTAVRVRVGGEDISVMHPVLCIESRGPLILRLGRTDDHTLKQLRASILCAREFLLDLLGSGATRSVLDWNERLFSYSMTQDGIGLHREFQIDVFRASLVEERLPLKFRTLRYPQMVAKLAAKRVRLGKLLRGRDT